MNNPQITHYKRIIWLLSGIIVLCVIASTIVSIAIWRSSHTNVPSKNSAQHTKKSTADTAHDQIQSNTPGSSASNQSSKNKTTTSASCKLLTAGIATQILGAAATAASPSDMSAFLTPDVTLSTCGYTASVSGSTQTVEITVRSPKNSLGVSENATAFGSERPTNAVTVSGYGQSAYWNPDTSRLNILASNTWYLISRTNNAQPSGQADAEAAAKLLAPGLQ
jgi:hypothetical protein